MTGIRYQGRGLGRRARQCGIVCEDSDCDHVQWHRVLVQSMEATFTMLLLIYMTGLLLAGSRIWWLSKEHLFVVILVSISNSQAHIKASQLFDTGRIRDWRDPCVSTMHA